MNDCAQDMHIDLMHVLYVYSRVMRGGGYLQSAVIIEVHTDMCIYGVQGYIHVYIFFYIYIYMYETRGVWGHAPPGKIRVFR